MLEALGCVGIFTLRIEVQFLVPTACEGTMCKGAETELCPFSGIWILCTLTNLYFHYLLDQHNKQWLLNFAVKSLFQVLQVQLNICHFHGIIECFGFGSSNPTLLLQWAGTSSTSSSCSDPHQNWPCMFSRMGPLSALWAYWSSFHHTRCKEFISI